MHGDLVFGKFTVGWCDLAFRADAPSAADAIKIDAKLARSRQDRGADGKVAAFAGGGENHEGIGAHGAAFC